MGENVFDELEREALACWRRGVDRGGEVWVEKTLSRMTAEQRYAQLLHPLLISNGERANGEEIRRVQPGGVFHPKAPWQAVRKSFDQWADGFVVPPIVSGDHECRVDFDGAVSVGSAMNLGAVPELGRAVGLAGEVGKFCALQARAAGVAWTFAPVADVNFNPDNPITNIRSFGDDPARVGELASAFVRGAQSAGLAATLKHFPGDGWDWRDQHVTTALNGWSRSDWERFSAAPFRAGLTAGAWSVMMGHIACPALESAAGHFLPATISPAIHACLRETLQFEGVIITDAIGMGGLQWHVDSEAEAVVRCLAAGADMILFPRDLAGAVEAIARAVRDKKLDPEALEASVRRILRLKSKAGLAAGKGAFPGNGAEIFAAAAAHGLDRRVAEASVTLCHGALPAPLEAGDRVILVDLPVEEPDGGGLVVAGQQAGPASAFLRALEGRGVTVVSVTDSAAFAREAHRAAAAIYRFFCRPQAGRNSLRICYRALQIIEQTRSPRLLKRFYLSMGSPYVARELPLPHLLCAYSNEEAVNGHCAEILTGRASPAGRLPVDT